VAQTDDGKRYAMRLQIQATTKGNIGRFKTTFTLKKGAIPLTRLNTIARKAFPNIPRCKIKIIGGAPLELGEVLMMARPDD